MSRISLFLFGIVLVAVCFGVGNGAPTPFPRPAPIIDPMAATILHKAFSGHWVARKAERAPIKLFLNISPHGLDHEYAVAAERMRFEADGSVILEDCCLSWAPYSDKQ
jgi:hypothetical protein